MEAGSYPTSKAGEVLAIAMLKNTNIGDTTLSSSKTQLINAAESRQAGTTRNYVLDDMDCDNLKSSMDSSRSSTSL